MLKASNCAVPVDAIHVHCNRYDVHVEEAHNCSTINVIVYTLHSRALLGVLR